jgi:hypothetical protein
VTKTTTKKKAKPKLKLYNFRMFELLDYCLANKKVTSKKDWFERIGSSANNESNYRSGQTSFTVDQVIEACKVSGFSSDWVMGLSEVKFRNESKLSPLDRIKIAVNELEKKK